MVSTTNFWTPNEYEKTRLNAIIKQHIEALQPEYEKRPELQEYGENSEPKMGPPEGHYDEIEHLLCFICT